MLSVTGVVLSSELTASGELRRIVISDQGRTNHLLMAPADLAVKVGESITRQVRASIERNREGRVTGFLTLWDATYQPRKRQGPAAS